MTPSPMPKDKVARETLAKEYHEHKWTRTRPAVSSSVIDRITLKRNASSANDTTTGKLAFTSNAGTAGPGPVCKVPALLRRATTNSSISSNGDGNGGNLGVEMQNRTSGFGDEGKIKRGAGKRSGLSGMLGRRGSASAGLCWMRVRSGARRERPSGRRVEARLSVACLGEGTFE